MSEVEELRVRGAEAMSRSELRGDVIGGDGETERAVGVRRCREPSETWLVKDFTRSRRCSRVSGERN